MERDSSPILIYVTIYRNMKIYQKEIPKHELGKLCALICLIVFLAFCLFSLKPTKITIKDPKMLKSSVKSDNSATLKSKNIVKIQKIKPSKTQVNSVRGHSKTTLTT